MLIVLLKIDLTKEDIPGAEDTVGAALLFANTIPTAISLVLSLLSHGLDVRDAIRNKDKGDKEGKQEVGRTELTPPCLMAVRIVLHSFFK